MDYGLVLDRFIWSPAIYKVVHSSAEKFHIVYTKIKAASRLIYLADSIILKSLSIALTVASPLKHPAKLLDNYVARQIKQIGEKYPVLNTPTQQIVDVFKKKTDRVRQVANRIKQVFTTPFDVFLHITGAKSRTPTARTKTKINNNCCSREAVAELSFNAASKPRATAPIKIDQCSVKRTTKQATLDIQRLHAKLKPTDIELFYSKVKPVTEFSTHLQHRDSVKSYDVRMLQSEFQALEQREIWENFRKHGDTAIKH
ncbi:unnamed protein product [Didymodactylos carnosus]|uniref:Uncharacterized protein n=1 Tax=Didymodactylos carnosus TaxID=1234261 RepID=A0A815EQL1_9BILA|nr:unnamed protein product [Didymodactylos carnosus]CAF1340672.1 unnamed protein product [Didymodactylos carnosus]CAF4151910.1 unnamed protein product [Didymodactylos carnosus]CAF4155410.1 unnamed protein product [Didymodactylos carnosus]